MRRRLQKTEEILKDKKRIFQYYDTDNKQDRAHPERLKDIYQKPYFTKDIANLQPNINKRIRQVRIYSKTQSIEKIARSILKV